MWRDAEDDLPERRLGVRLAISVAIAAALIAMVAGNLPESHLRTQLAKATDPWTNALGFRQDWGVFAPDPRRSVRYVEARVFYADGSQQVWKPPADADTIGAYRAYRWHKFAERLVVDTNESMWEPTARYVLRELDDREAAPVSVSLVRRWREILPPGFDHADPPFMEHTFYTLEAKA